MKRIKPGTTHAQLKEFRKLRNIVTQGALVAQRVNKSNNN
jgi:hypothetical protein